MDGITNSGQDPVTPEISENLEEGALYVLRKGKLEKLPRDDENGMRKVRITEDAYTKAMEVGQRMRKELRGYKPDVSLVVSAVLLNVDDLEVQKHVKTFVVRMFSE